MKKRSEKQQDLDKLKVELAKVSTVILSTFQGITVEDDNKLRRAVQQAGGSYRVVKNTLAERAGVGTPNEALLKNLFKGTNSIAYTATDPVSLGQGVDQDCQGCSGVSVPRGNRRWARAFDRGESNNSRPCRRRKSCLDQQGRHVPAGSAGRRASRRLWRQSQSQPGFITVNEAVKANKFGADPGTRRGSGRNDLVTFSMCYPPRRLTRKGF